MAFKENDRNAMRAYLQRAEVRLSTMHRVASAFLGGAGLLILFPVFFREVFAGLLKSFLEPATGIVSLAPSIFLAGAFCLSLAIPLYALYLLLKDLVHFYFVGHSPGFPPKLFNPRFVLSGIAFSPDESPDVKKAVLISQYSSDLINFVLPFGEAQAAYYDNVITSTRSQILPEERRFQHLVDSGVILELPDTSDVQVQSSTPERRSPVDIDRFNAALGLAGVRDRSLVAEVAKMEASLVRHTTGLRRLVLRYIKALLMFIVTTLISFLLISLIETHRFPAAVVLALGYLCWAIVTPIVVKFPVRWIYESANQNAESVVQRDSQLVLFEKKVIFVSWVAAGLAVLSLLLIVVSGAIT